jgi:hypothetical protein
METTVVAPVVIEVAEEHHVARARQTAKALARAAGFSRPAACLVATSASELATNLVLHATRGGSITIAAFRRDDGVSNNRHCVVEPSRAATALPIARAARHGVRAFTEASLAEAKTPDYVTTDYTPRGSPQKEDNMGSSVVRAHAGGDDATAPWRLRYHVAETIRQALFSSRAADRPPGRRRWIDDLSRPWTEMGAACAFGCVNDLMGGVLTYQVNEFNSANSVRAEARIAALHHVLTNVRAMVIFLMEACPDGEYSETLDAALQVLHFMLQVHSCTVREPVVDLRALYEAAGVEFGPEPSR